ncbi:MAG: hypothetical protein QOE53_1276 [Pseudonocardiales bacterium]|jgi:hypothetical protein|nr:hypothetical protein [Pseudonocardiales bacterium]
MGRPATVCIGALAIVLLLAGCTRPGPPAAARSLTPSLSDVGVLPSVSTPRITTTEGMQLPIERYDATAAERKIVGDAVDFWVGKCMSSFGLSWVPAGSDDRQPVPQLVRAYGVADPVTAAELGYHTAGDSSGKPLSPPRLTPDQIKVYGGARDGSGRPKAALFRDKMVPAGGCARQGLVAVVDDPELDPNSVADQILISMGAKARSDARVAAVIASWSSCMSRAGYQFSDPLDAVSRAMTAGPKPTAAEIRTAVADITCKNKVNLLGTWYAVDAGYERLAIRQNSKQLGAVQSAWRAAVTKAASSLGRPAPPAHAP